MVQCLPEVFQRFSFTIIEIAFSHLFFQYRQEFCWRIKFLSLWHLKNNKMNYYVTKKFIWLNKVSLKLNKVSLSFSDFFSFDSIFEKINFVNFISLSNQISRATVGEPKKNLFHAIIRKESYFSDLNTYFSLFNLRILANGHIMSIWSHVYLTSDAYIHMIISYDHIINNDREAWRLEYNHCRDIIWSFHGSCCIITANDHDHIQLYHVHVHVHDHHVVCWSIQWFA